MNPQRSVRWRCGWASVQLLCDVVPLLCDRLRCLWRLCSWQWQSRVGGPVSDTRCVVDVGSVSAWGLWLRLPSTWGWGSVSPALLTMSSSALLMVYGSGEEGRGGLNEDTRATFLLRLPVELTSD